MDANDRAKFAVMMGELAIAFRTEISREDIEVYFKHCQGLTLYQVGLAARDIINSDDRFPTLPRLKSVARIQKVKPEIYQDVPQIEEQTFSNDMPKTKEEFFGMIDGIVEGVTVPGGSGMTRQEEQARREELQRQAEFLRTTASDL